MSKPTGLAAFTKKNTASTQQTVMGQEQGAKQSTNTPQRGRGKGDVVALTVRLPRAEWERLHQLAVSEGVSIQSLAVIGLSKVFAEKGLPTLSV